VDTGTILFVHLIKFVDQTNTFVCQHKGTSFKGPFLSDGVFMHTGCETDSTSTFTCSVDDSVVHSFNVLKELGLRSAWVTEKQHVDVTSDPMLSAHILGLATEHAHGKSLLDELMAVN